MRESDKVKNSSFLMVGILAGICIGAVSCGHFMINDMKKKAEWADKQLSVAQMLNQWLSVKQQKKSISAYLYSHGYRKVAIYGMNYLGERLLSELKDSEVQVLYVIDNNTKSVTPDIRFCTPDDLLEKVDAIIVSVNYYYDEICKNLSEKVDYPIINLENILFDM